MEYQFRCATTEHERLGSISGSDKILLGYFVGVMESENVGTRLMTIGLLRET